MPLLTAEAAKLSNDDLRAGIVETIITTDQLFGLLPFKPVNGRAYVYNRENALVEGDFVDTNDAITEGAATFTNINQKLKRIVGDVDVDDFLEETYSDTNDQAGIQIAKKTKGVARKFANTVINGDETGFPKQFDGLIELVAGSQSFNGGGPVALSFDHLDTLIDNVKIGGQLCFIMNSRTVRSYAALCRALGGTNPEQVGNLPGITGTMIGYRGIPILRSDWVPITQGAGTETQIFLAALEENEGLCGLMSAKSMGIEVKIVGPVQDKDAMRYRVRWYASLALHSTLALATFTGINN